MRLYQLILALFGLCATLALADVSPRSARVLRFSGRLLDEQAHAVPGPVTLEVGFFRSEEGDDALPSPPIRFPSVALDDGVFHVTLVLTADETNRIYGDGTHAVYLQVRDETHGRTYRRQRSEQPEPVPQPPPADPAGNIQLPSMAADAAPPTAPAAPAAPAASAPAPATASLAAATSVSQPPAVAQAATGTSPATSPLAAAPAPAPATSPLAAAPAPAPATASLAAATTVSEPPAVAQAATGTSPATPNAGGAAPPQPSVDPLHIAAGAACLASPVAGAKFLVQGHDPTAPCAATCTAAQLQATCVRGWTFFAGGQTFDFGNECTAAVPAQGLALVGRLCCCLTTSGPMPLLP